MRVFVAGGSGAIGKQLVPALVAAGHQVTATTRNPRNTASLGAAGVGRVIAQSYAGWPNARTGGPVKTEDDPLDANPPAGQRRLPPRPSSAPGRRCACRSGSGGLSPGTSESR